jgi:hypothetical protein
LTADVGEPGGRVSVIAELKRRNIFRVAALYVVAAWVLLQVGDLLFDRFLRMLAGDPRYKAFLRKLKLPD